MTAGDATATPALHARLLHLGATDRPELALRAGVVVLAGFTLVVALVPDLHGHAIAPAVDLVLDTTAVIVSASLTALAWVRYRERREPIALFQASAFLTLAVAYSVAETFPVFMGRRISSWHWARPSTGAADRH